MNNIADNNLNWFFNQSNDGFITIKFTHPIDWNNEINKNDVLDSILENQKILSFNNALLLQYRVTEHEIYNIEIYKLFSQSVDEAKKMWLKLFDIGQYKFNTTIRRFDGSKLKFEGSYKCFYNTEGKISGYNGVHISIAEENAEININNINLNELCSKAINSINDCVYIINLNWQIELVNKAQLDFNKKLGLSDDIIGMKIDKVYSIFFNENRKKEYIHVFETGEEVFKDDITFFSDNEINIEIKKTPVFQNGKVTKVLTTISDVSDGYKINNELTESKERNRRIFENIKDVYFETAIDGTILELSPSIEAHYNFSRSELINSSILDLYENPDDRERFIHDLRNNRLLNDYEINLCNKQGVLLPCSLTAELIYDKNNLPAKICGTLRNIADRKKAEEKLKLQNEELIEAEEEIRVINDTLANTNSILQESEENYRQLFNLMLNGFAYLETIFDDNGKLCDCRYIDMNPAYENLINLKKTSAIGKTVMELMPGTEKSWFETLDTVVATGKPLNFHMFHKVTDRFYSVSAYQLKLNTIACVFENITEQKNSEIKLKKHNEALLTARQEINIVNDDLCDANISLILSERRFKDITLIASDFIWEVDREGYITYASENVEDVLGYTSIQMIGKKPFDFSKSKEKKRLNNLLVKIIGRNKKIVGLVNNARHKNGKIVGLISNGVPILDSTSKLLGYRGVSKDITSDIEAKEKDKKHKKDLILLKRSAVDFLKFPDEKDIFEYIVKVLVKRVKNTILILNLVNKENNNLVLYKISGVNDVLLNSITKLLNWKPSKKTFILRGEIKNILKKGKITEINDGFKYFIDDSTDNHVSNAIKNLININKVYTIGITRNKQLLGSINFLTLDNSIIEDVSFVNAFVSQASIAIHRKQLETELIEQKSKAEELNRTKDKLFSIIAHDLKNPFNVLLGVTDLLMDGFDNYNKNRLKELIELLNTAANQGYSLLENLLNWSRAQTGRIKYNPESLNLFELITSNIDLIETMVENKNIKIQSNIKDNHIVYCDIDTINVVIRNLLTNAIKFTPEHGSIYVNATENTNFVEVSIKDNGVGIEKENIDKIFNQSSDFSTKGTDNEKGTGLGLILCKEFIENNKGTISVESEINKGSTFRFTLPKA